MQSDRHFCQPSQPANSPRPDKVSGETKLETKRLPATGQKLQLILQVKDMKKRAGGRVAAPMAARCDPPTLSPRKGVPRDSAASDSSRSGVRNSVVSSSELPVLMRCLISSHPL